MCSKTTLGSSSDKLNSSARYLDSGVLLECHCEGRSPQLLGEQKEVHYLSHVHLELPTNLTSDPGVFSSLWQEDNINFGSSSGSWGERGVDRRSNPYTLLASLRIWGYWPTLCSSTSIQWKIWQHSLNHEHCFFMTCTRRRTLTSVLTSTISLQSVSTRRRPGWLCDSRDWSCLSCIRKGSRFPLVC